MELVDLDFWGGAVCALDLLHHYAAKRQRRTELSNSIPSQQHLSFALPTYCRTALRPADNAYTISDLASKVSYSCYRCTQYALKNRMRRRHCIVLTTEFPFSQLGEEEKRVGVEN